MPYPLTTAEIAAWFPSRQPALEGSSVSLASIREGGHASKPSACADFDGANTTGRITGWVSGEFDLEVIRGSDGKDLLWRHVDASTLADLEIAYLEFLTYMEGASASAQP